MRDLRVHLAIAVVLGVLCGSGVQRRDDGTWAIAFASPAARPAPEIERATPQLEVTVTAAGHVLVEGQAISLERLAARVEDAKAAGYEEVWYYRENPFSDPPPIARPVIELLTRHGVRIATSTAPDFSNWVDASGRPRPR